MKRWLCLIGVVLSVHECAYAEKSFSFAVIGDAPYSLGEVHIVKDILGDISQSSASFVIHNGDIKSGGESCQDSLLQERVDLLNSSPKPMFYTVGDNEWTDCHRRSNGSYMPLERLEFLRQIAFKNNVSLGQKNQALQRQINYPENQRWQYKSITFVSLNIPGSNNNLNPPANFGADLANDYKVRMQANREWLKENIEWAQLSKSNGLVISIQGNPFENTPDTPIDKDGFHEVRAMLLEATRMFNKPILLTHGDSHVHRVDQPLIDEQGKTVTQLTRLENFGYPFSGNWVQVFVDPTKKDLFKFETRRLFQQRSQ